MKITPENLLALGAIRHTIPDQYVFCIGDSNQCAIYLYPPTTDRKEWFINANAMGFHHRPVYNIQCIFEAILAVGKKLKASQIKQALDYN